MSPARQIIFITLTILASAQTSAFPAEKMAERVDTAMGTMVQIKVPVPSGTDERSVNEMISKAFDEIRRVESVFSVYIESSEISRINRLQKDEELKISDEAFDLIKRSLAATGKTGGAFDITVKPLVDLWKKAKESGIMPSKEEIEAARGRTGWKGVQLDAQNRTIKFLKTGMSLDLGGVAKGYATDAAIKVLKDGGISRGIVNCGGDMFCMGKPSAKKPWRIGIRHPRKKDRVFLEIVLEDKAADTSGDYEKYFTLDGKRYSHIIDPRTGFPIGDGVVSATVLANDSATADIYATALCILGLKGFSALEAEGLDAIIMLKDRDSFDLKMTKGFLKKYERR